jgi:serine-type D-Ala-D-Ala carboxypeptidase/endopeptidase (penicillin-binding protein 4)
MASRFTRGFRQAVIIEGPDNPWMPPARCALGLLLALVLARAPAQGLPPEVEAALARAQLPAGAVTMLVVPADGQGPARLSHRSNVPVNPASIAKLATTIAALDLLGPAFTWTTPVYVDGPVRDGTLQGNLYLKGSGDPELVAERLWLLLRRVRGLGIEAIAGDIVLDRSAFETAPPDPAAFDGEPLRPYNAAPDALLVNFKSVVLTFTPFGQQARVAVEPPVAGLRVPAAVPLARGECNDWRGALKADFSDPARIRFAGSYPLACGERTWPVAATDPAGFGARAIAGMWRELGGRLAGTVREGTVPAALAPTFTWSSPPLAEVVRDINKFSNNVMAQQVFLTLSLQRQGTGTFEASRAILRQWWRERVGGSEPTFTNGAGLSREERVTAEQLARLLQMAWRSPLMPELMSSLPLAGVDGTLRRARGEAVGVAHLKTGSLRSVTGVAGYVHAASGRRYVLVAIANDARAAAVRPAIEALLDWTVHDQ